MKRCFRLFAFFALCAIVLVSCAQTTVESSLGKERLRLSAFVGVWTNEEEDRYYRFTPTGLWFLYNVSGQVEKKGEVDFDGEIFTLVATDGEVNELTVKNNAFVDSQKNEYKRTDSPSSLISSLEYEIFFNDWYEESNLEGNVLSLSEPDSWQLKDSDGEVLFNGSFYAYVDEPDSLYLYYEEDGSYFARLTPSDPDLIMEQAANDRVQETVFSTAENSTVRYFYFKDKGVACNYVLDSGSRLLRNGGAAFNDEHEYKKMPVTCSISTLRDVLDESGMRNLEISVVYEFKRTDLPYLSGGIFYNSVRFSQYDYYTGELFYMDDSTGDVNIASSWVTEHDGISYGIECSFSSDWKYSTSEEILARFQGTYCLTMPADYDGFVICLRPVFNSYSAQISSALAPVEGTLMMEDVGEDVEKSIFCRIPKYTEEINLQTDPAI